MKTVFDSTKISRRSFLQALGALTLSGGLSACGGTAETKKNALTAGSLSYELDEVVTVEFSDGGISVSPEDAAGVEADGTALTVSGAGVYALSGSCGDGSIKVAAETEKVVLLLNGLTLTSADTAPIVCGKSTGVTIAAADNTENTLTDSEANNPDNDADNENAEKAVIKCKDGSRVLLCGGGALAVNALGKNGIKSGTALDDRDASLTIRELDLTIEALVNDAINAEQLLNVESGTLNIAAGDDAVHCDLELNIGAEGTAGPAIAVSTCYEGLEGAVLNIYSGSIDITATDDCLNAANSDLGDYAFEMNIFGGTIRASSSEGDGFDSNGTMTITDGNITVWTMNTADNQPLDADGVITISGGTILAAGGSAGMGFSINASQPYVTFGGDRNSSVSLTAGKAFSITDESGKSVLDATAVCDAAFVFYSSASLTADGTYSMESTVSSTAQTGEADTQFGGNGGPGGGQRPGDGQTPPDGAPTDGQAPADGQMPQGQPPQSDGTTPPELPAASNN